MNGWLRQLALSAQARAGLSADIVIWSVVAAVALALAAIFLVIAAFVWLSHHYGITIASLALGIFFLILALISLFACALVRRRNIQRARRELEMRKAADANLLDPKLLALGYQIGDAIGWRRLASLVAVGLLAASVAREWTGHRRGGADEGEGGPES
jgi:hypothetical protein